MLTVQVESLGKSFGKKVVLENIDLDFSMPGITTILGPNASGKTTMIKSILGMVFPDKGVVRVNGMVVNGQSAYKKDISYLPQIAQFPENLKVTELIKLIEDIRGKGHRADALINLFGLRPHLNERITILSGGTKQKVNVVLAFMYDNPLLILDEPTNGLDPVALVRLKDLIRKEVEMGKVIIITTHIMELVEELSDRIIYMLEGRVHFKGTVDELKLAYGSTTVEKSIARMLEDGEMTSDEKQSLA
ncbi:MAG: ABC transporter ATP-binding protein [Vicingaceae bacterium]